MKEQDRCFYFFEHLFSLPTARVSGCPYMIDNRSDETSLKCHKCFNSIYAKLKSLVQFRRMVFSSQGNTKHVSVTSNTKGPGCLEAISNNRIVAPGNFHLTSSDVNRQRRGGYVFRTKNEYIDITSMHINRYVYTRILIRAHVFPHAPTMYTVQDTECNMF